MLEIIFIIILVGYFILILVGLGFLTYGMFNLTTGTVPKIINDASIENYIKTKPTASNYTEKDREAEAKTIPTIETAVPNGDIVISLDSSRTIIAKITLISLWIFIGIGVIMSFVGFAG